MTITVRRSVEFSRTIEYNENTTDTAAEVSLTKLEANHHYSILDETVEIAMDDCDHQPSTVLETVG